MPVLHAPSSSGTASEKPSLPRPAQPNGGLAHVRASLSILDQHLRTPRADGRPADIASLQHARTAVAAALEQCRSLSQNHPLTDALLRAADSLSALTESALPVENTNPAPTASGWQAALAAMFAGPLWQARQLRSIEALPVWFWPSYARHLFIAPAFFQSTEQETQWASHVQFHLDAAVRTLEANRGSAAAKTVAQLALASSVCWPVVGTAEASRHRALALGRLRTLLAPRLAPHRPHSNQPSFFALRVALISGASDPNPGVFDPAQLQALVDPERIELTCHTPPSLPSDLAAQVDTLRAAHFDAVIFAGDLTLPDDPVAQLAIYRIAPRQFATALSPRSSGLPEIDVLLSDTLADADAFSEQLARLPAALAFEVPAETPSDAPVVTRADLGLPDDAHLLVATIHPAHVSVATRERWQRLLDQDPCVRLILVPAAASSELRLLFGECERCFGERILLASDQPLDTTALTTLLRVCDGYVVGASPADHHNRQLAQHLGLTVANVPPRIDGLAYAEALTAIVETACRSPGAPLFVPAEPISASDRHAKGKELLAAGRADRASFYLLAAIEQPNAGADVWHDLALALHANNQPADAIQALETCVRFDATRLDSWLLLADWSSHYGHADLVADIAGVVKELAPQDPRVLALTASLSA